MINTKAVRSSPRGYCHDNKLPQVRQRRFCIIKERTGISSYHVKYFPQLKHRDLSETIDSPVFKRRTTTLIKLPTVRPNRNKNISRNTLLLRYIVTFIRCRCSTATIRTFTKKTNSIICIILCDGTICFFQHCS